MDLADGVKTLTTSKTLAITAKAKEMKQEGHDVIGLCAGEPDFNTPEYIIEAVEQAMREGLTKYSPSGDITELKKAIIQNFELDNDLKYGVDEIIVTAGAKHALYNLFEVLLNEGDEVIIPSPFWVSYPEQVKLANGTPIILEGKEENGFKLTPEELEKGITANTKAFVINSPSNPTGVIYSKNELEALGKVCLKHNIFIISDEIYE